jgi:arylsulfatase A-like enzyme
MARRLAESGVRFVQITDGGWDHHGKLRQSLPVRCKAVDKPIAALITDLKQRGLLDDTLVLWGGEFGRTPFDQDLSQGKGPMNERGREHNPKGFTMFMAGGGTKPGISYGATDEFGWHAVEGKVHIHDLHATMLHLVGIDHEKLTYRYTGRDYRLTDVAGRVVKEILL